MLGRRGLIRRMSLAKGLLIINKPMSEAWLPREFPLSYIPHSEALHENILKLNVLCNVKKPPGPHQNHRDLVCCSWAQHGKDGPLETLKRLQTSWLWVSWLSLSLKLCKDYWEWDWQFILCISSVIQNNSNF